MRKIAKHCEQIRLCSITESREVRQAVVTDDLAPFRPHIDRFDLTDAEKRELIAAITLMAEMVLDVHFKVHRYQALYEVDCSGVQSHGDSHEAEA